MTDPENARSFDVREINAQTFFAVVALLNTAKQNHQRLDLPQILGELGNTRSVVHVVRLLHHTGAIAFYEAYGEHRAGFSSNVTNTEDSSLWIG